MGICDFFKNMVKYFDKTQGGKKIDYLHFTETNNNNVYAYGGRCCTL